MAAVRCAARRLGGALLQRTATSPAAAAPRRLTHSEALDKARREEVLRKLQRKKEELYDVLCEAEKHWRLRDFRLVHSLSAQVSPRPWDPRWRDFQFNRESWNLVIFSLLYLFGPPLLRDCASKVAASLPTDNEPEDCL